MWVTFITMSTKFFNSEQLMFSRIWLSLLSQHNHTAGHTLSDNMWLSSVSAVMKQRSFYLLIINCNNYQDIIIIIAIICKAHFLYKHVNVSKLTKLNGRPPSWKLIEKSHLFNTINHQNVTLPPSFFPP